MRFVLGAVLPLALLVAGPAFAAGGEHVVDDAAVETPGTCHLENWITAASDGQGLAYSAPACTPAALPQLEIGGFITHIWAPDARDTVIGLTPKLNLRSEDLGVGIGISTGIGYSIARGKLDSASVIVPVTVPVGKQLRVNFNLGWQWGPAGHDLFVGGQAEIALKRNLSLMVETFGRDRRKVGGQAGLRWTTAKGRADFDIIAGRYVDGTTPTSVTLGITLRR